MLPAGVGEPFFFDEVVAEVSPPPPDWYLAHGLSVPESEDLVLVEAASSVVSKVATGAPPPDMYLSHILPAGVGLLFFFEEDDVVDESPPPPD
jgi:hypothetical protein